MPRNEASKKSNIDISEDKTEEEKILKLWSDINFPGAYRGIKTFQAVLKTDKGISISQKKLYEILQKQKTYLTHQVKPFRTKYRSAITHNYGEVVQADIAYMFEDGPKSEKYFLLLIDVYSNKIFVEVIPNKDSKTVATALENIFRRFGAPIYEIQTGMTQIFQVPALLIIVIVPFY